MKAFVLTWSTLHSAHLHTYPVKITFPLGMNFPSQFRETRHLTILDVKIGLDGHHGALGLKLNPGWIKMLGDRRWNLNFSNRRAGIQSERFSHLHLGGAIQVFSNVHDKRHPLQVTKEKV